MLKWKLQNSKLHLPPFCVSIKQYTNLKQRCKNNMVEIWMIDNICTAWAYPTGRCVKLKWNVKGLSVMGRLISKPKNPFLVGECLFFNQTMQEINNLRMSRMLGGVSKINLKLCFYIMIITIFNISI